LIPRPDHEPSYRAEIRREAAARQAEHDRRVRRVRFELEERGAEGATVREIARALTPRHGFVMVDPWARALAELAEAGEAWRDGDVWRWGARPTTTATAPETTATARRAHEDQRQQLIHDADSDGTERTALIGPPMDEESAPAALIATATDAADCDDTNTDTRGGAAEASPRSIEDETMNSGPNADTVELRRKMLAWLTENPGQPATAMGAAIGWSGTSAGIQWHMNRMEAEKLVRRTGTRNQTRWYVTAKGRTASPVASPPAVETELASTDSGAAEASSSTTGGDHARLNDAPPVGARPEGAQPGVADESAFEEDEEGRRNQDPESLEIAEIQRREREAFEANLREVPPHGGVPTDPNAPTRKPDPAIPPELAARAARARLTLESREDGTRRYWRHADHRLAAWNGSDIDGWYAITDATLAGRVYGSEATALSAALDWLDGAHLSPVVVERAAALWLRRTAPGRWERDGLVLVVGDPGPEGGFITPTGHHDVESGAVAAVCDLLTSASSPTAPATTAQAQPAPAEEPAAGRGEGDHGGDCDGPGQVPGHTFDHPDGIDYACCSHPACFAVEGRASAELACPVRSSAAMRADAPPAGGDPAPAGKGEEGRHDAGLAAFLVRGGDLRPTPDPRDARIAELERDLSGYQRVVLDVQEAIEQTDLDTSRPITDRVREIVGRMKGAEAERDAMTAVLDQIGDILGHLDAAGDGPQCAVFADEIGRLRRDLHMVENLVSGHTFVIGDDTPIARKVLDWMTKDGRETGDAISKAVAERDEARRDRSEALRARDEALARARFAEKNLRDALEMGVGLARLAQGESARAAAK
jgi:hypothetical protein